MEQEKEDLRAAFDGVLQKVQEQHCSDLADLEERLKTFYSTEWEKVHQTYQEEADKCKAQMEQQVWKSMGLFSFVLQCPDTFCRISFISDALTVILMLKHDLFLNTM